jgi:hypothetical protein
VVVLTGMNSTGADWDTLKLKVGNPALPLEVGAAAVPLAAPDDDPVAAPPRAAKAEDEKSGRGAEAVEVDGVAAVPVVAVALAGVVEAVVGVAWPLMVTGRSVGMPPSCSNCLNTFARAACAGPAATSSAMHARAVHTPRLISAVVCCVVLLTASAVLCCWLLLKQPECGLSTQLYYAGSRTLPCHSTGALSGCLTSAAGNLWSAQVLSDRCSFRSCYLLALCSEGRLCFLTLCSLLLLQ